MAKHPRVECPVCRGVYAGVPTSALGVVSVHDHKRTPRALVLCEGSMARVPAVDATAYQDELPNVRGSGSGSSGAGVIALFDVRDDAEVEHGQGQ